MKICKKCEEEKPLEDFGRTGKYYKSHCRKCLNESSSLRYHTNKEVILAKERQKRAENIEAYRAKQNEIYHKNPGKTREYNLKRYYGLTIDQYNEILSSQGGGCAICGKTPEQEKRNLAVDHDHKNLSIRGLLCGWCNRHFIGHHRDPDLFKKAGEYLSTATGLFVPTSAPKRQRSRKRKRST